MPTSKSESHGQQSVSPWLRFFVYFHLVGIIVWSVPRPRPEIVSGTVRPWGNEWLILANNRYLQESPLKYYLQCTGLWQYWDMFAPDPLRRDFYMDANVTYKDGSRAVFDYPRMANLNLKDRYLSERYRKFFERINETGLDYIWAGVALRIAQKMDTHPGNPPTSIDLVRHWKEIAPPGKQQEPDYRSLVFFTCHIDPNALRGAEMESR